MPAYSCRVKDINGRSSTLLRYAESEQEAASTLSASGYFTLEIREQRERSHTGKLGRKFLLDFTSSLAIMLDSGLPLKEAIEMNTQSASHKKTASVTRQMAERLDKGEDFHRILDQWPRDFFPLYKSLIRIGEQSGNLGEIFTRLQYYLEQKKELRDKIIGALLYPLLVIGAAVLGTIALSIFILPAVKRFFMQMGQNMPDKLDKVIGRLDTMTVLGIAVPLTIAVLILIFTLLRRKSRLFGTWTDALLIRIPVVGPFFLDQEMLNFMFAMEILLSNGMTVEDALEEASGVIRNRAIQSSLEQIRLSITQGLPFSAACAREPLFPVEVSRWISISEKTGAIDQVFNQLKNFYQKEVEKKASRIMSLIEPVLIMGVGAFILLIVIFFILPIFSVYEVFL